LYISEEMMKIGMGMTCSICWGETRGFGGENVRKGPLGLHRCRWKSDIEMDPKIWVVVWGPDCCDSR